MPHSTIGEFKGAKNAISAASNLLDRLILLASKEREVREALQDSTFDITTNDREVTLEFDFAPTVDHTDEVMMKFYMEVNGFCGSFAEEDTTSLTHRKVWRRSRLSVVCLFNHKGPSVPEPGEPTIEKTIDATSNKPPVQKAQKMVKAPSTKEN